MMYARSLKHFMIAPQGKIQKPRVKKGVCSVGPIHFPFWLDSKKTEFWLFLDWGEIGHFLQDICHDKCPDSGQHKKLERVLDTLEKGTKKKIIG